MSFKTCKEFTKKNQAMEKTPSSSAVDKYMSKISKILTCTKKFKIIVLVAEVWCVNYFFFFLQFFHFIKYVLEHKNAQY